MLAAYQSLIQRAQGNAQQPYSPTIAPFNQSQQAAFNSFDQIPGQYLPQAVSYAQQGSSPITAGQISDYSNPFQQSVIDATMGNINETNAQQQNQVVGNALAQGALGGDRVGVARAELARQQGLANNQTLAGLNAANYQQALQAAQADRSAAQTGAGLFAGLQGTALQGAQAQLGSGTVQQNQATGLLQEQAAFPYQQTNWLSSILGGVGPLEGTKTSGQVKTPAPGILQQVLGGGLAAAGLAGQLGWSPFGAVSGGGLSDAALAATQGAGLFRHGGRVPHLATGGIAIGSGAHRMISDAMTLAHTMKAGIGGYAPGGNVFPAGISMPLGFNADQRINDAATINDPFSGTDMLIPHRMFSLNSALPDNTGATIPPYTPPASGAPDALAYAPPTAGIAAQAAPAPDLALAGPSSPAQAPAARGASWGTPLLAAGLGILASQSPNIGTAIGEGGLAGLKVAEGLKAAAAERADKAQETAMRARSLDLEAKRLDEQAKQAAAQLALDTRKVNLEGTQPQSTAGKLAYDLAHHNITQEAYDKATAGSGTLLSDDAVDLITDQVIAGDNSAMTGYARNPAMKAQIINALALKANDQGLDGAAIAARAAAYMGDKAAQRSAGTRAAQVGMAASEANQMADIALEASKSVPRGDIVPWTKAVQAVQTGTSSPEMAAFVTATTSLVNAYARAVSPLGTPTDAMRQHAEAMLNVAQGPEAYEAVIKQMKKEMRAALDAPAEIRQSLIDRGTGKPAVSEGEPVAAAPTAATDAPPVPGARKAPDGNWYVTDPETGGYLMVQP